MRKLPTGEPCAGEPHARFGERGRRKPFPDPYQMPFKFTDSGSPPVFAAVARNDDRILLRVSVRGLLAHAHAALRIPLKNFFALGQRRLRNFADGYSELPIRRTDGNEARIAAQAAGEFRIADRD